MKSTPTVPHMSDDALRTFVVDYLAGRVWTSAGVPVWDLPYMFAPLRLVRQFMSDAEFAALRARVEQAGVLWAHIQDAGEYGSAMNGRPMFPIVRLMHVDDWARARAAIAREQARQANIEV